MANRFLEIQICKAVALKKDGELDVAARMLDDLIAEFPDEPELRYHRGTMALEQRDNPDACTHFRHLVRLRPEFLEGRMLLGMVLAELGEHEEAVLWLRGVLDECPDLPEVRHRLGLCLADLHRYGEAVEEYRQVLAKHPDHVGVLCALGLLLTSTGQVGEARAVLLRALEHDPHALNVINNLGRVCKIGHADESLTWFQRGLDLDPEHPALTSNYLYTLNYVPCLSPAFIASKYFEYAPRAFHPPDGWAPPFHPKKSPGDTIRIGLLSADFYGHSVAFFLEPYMMHHDSREFELFCYSNRAFEDETTARLRSCSTGWRCIVGVPDEKVARIIAEDRIDVLVDLSGHTSGHRLGVCALKPAPVQVSWLGHPNTTGLPQMDYFISDHHCSPPGMVDRYFTETVWRLPRIFCSYLPPEEFPPVQPAHPSRRGEVVFGCFTSMTKINGELIALWGRILHALPGARLFMKGVGLESREGRDELLDRFRRVGIPEDRLLLKGVTGTRREHLAMYELVDIALDTFPYHGTTTTCEALWMGVPVVTLAGGTHVSRVGCSLLHSVGLGDLVAETAEGYVAAAVALADDRERREFLRENLRLMMARSPLMDWEGVTREIEAAFRKMVGIYLQGVG